MCVHLLQNSVHRSGGNVDVHKSITDTVSLTLCNYLRMLITEENIDSDLLSRPLLTSQNPAAHSKLNHSFLYVLFVTRLEYLICFLLLLMQMKFLPV